MGKNQRKMKMRYKIKRYSAFRSTKNIPKKSILEKYPSLRYVDNVALKILMNNNNIFKKSQKKNTGDEST